MQKNYSKKFSSLIKRLRFYRKRKNWITPGKGYCGYQNTFDNYYKICSVVKMNGIITHFDRLSANIHDIKYLIQINDYYPGYAHQEDSAYLREPLQWELFKKNRLLTKMPMRRNQKKSLKQPVIFRDLKKFMETVVYQFPIQENDAKKFWSLLVWIRSIRTSLALLQYLNKLHFHNELNLVKYSLL